MRSDVTTIDTASPCVAFNTGIATPGFMSSIAMRKRPEEGDGGARSTVCADCAGDGDGESPASVIALRSGGCEPAYSQVSAISAAASDKIIFSRFDISSSSFFVEANDHAQHV